MEKNTVSLYFSERLKDALIKAGLHSLRSTSGVDIHKLVEITGYSPQICRKYLRGQAIPEPYKLIEIAEKLNVSPGWLLFGDHKQSEDQENILISKQVLHYIFSKAQVLYNTPKVHTVADFLVQLSCDISQISTTAVQSKKIIDLAFTSLGHHQPEEA
jgi:transcriptional regulator with XRE-family HTH domain